MRTDLIPSANPARSPMAHTLAAGSRNDDGSRPQAATHRRPGGRSRSHADRPINHHVTDHTVADPDKSGRTRNDRIPTKPNRPQPLTTRTLQPGPTSHQPSSRATPARFP